MPTLEQFKQIDWYKERPQIIKDLICKFPYASTEIIYRRRYIENA